jgi:prepilin signal peptidase PulO-like enzyme (type II secretory pathway)
MFFALFSTLALAGAAHTLRRATPALVGLRDRRLPFSWPWLELCGGGLGWLIGREAGWPPDGRLWPLAALALVLLAACSTDYLVKLIPDSITFGGALAGILLSALFPELIRGQSLHGILLAAWGFTPGGDGALPEPALGAILATTGALVGFALLELVRRVAGLVAGIEAMGMGDSKLLMAIGAFLGPFGAAATLAISFLLGVVHGGLAALLTRKPHAPFGPALAAAAFFYLFAGDLALAGWERFQVFMIGLPTFWLVAFYAVLLAAVLLLVLRVRRRAAEYEEIIEAEYAEVDQLLEGADPAKNESKSDD